MTIRTIERVRALGRGVRLGLLVLLCAALLGVQPALADHGAPTDDPSELVLVFPQPADGTWFFNDWGQARPGGRRHRGTDIVGAKGDPVLAVADGFVERVAVSRRSGYHVMIRHRDGWTSWYMHLNDDTPGTDDGEGGWEHAIAPGIEPGAYVKAGQLIGWVGDSGNAEWTVPHTHFELHRNGRAVNPYRYLKAAWEHLQIERAIERGELPYR